MAEKCILDPDRDCLGLIKAREVEQDVNELRKQNSASHERLFDRLGELERQEGIQGEQYKHILEKLDSLVQKVDALEARPAKRWEGVVAQVIGLVVAALVGLVLARLGM